MKINLWPALYVAPLIVTAFTTLDLSSNKEEALTVAVALLGVAMLEMLAIICWMLANRTNDESRPRGK